MKKIAILLLGLVFMYACQEEKTAFVDSDKLKENYESLATSNKEFDDRQQEMQMELQKEGQGFQQKVEKYQEERESMSQSEQEEREGELMQEQQELQQKQQMQQSLVMQQKQQMEDSLVDVMKGKIKEFADSRNYTYVFGTGEDNIMYADEGKDITDDVLEELNSESADEPVIDEESIEEEMDQGDADMEDLETDQED